MKMEANLKNIEKILHEASRNHVTSCNKSLLQETKVLVEQIILQLVTAMKKQSPIFAQMYLKNFGVGSAYEQTKIGDPNEFDIDIVLKIPGVNPVVKNEEVSGFVQVQLENFDNTLKSFVDKDNFMLSQEMMLLFIHRVLLEAKETFFPNGVIKVAQKQYIISKTEYTNPALTLTIEGPDFFVSVDLVASFSLSQNFWPVGGNWKKNPCLSEKEFFLAPARPVVPHPHKQRFWRLSFHLQERKIMMGHQWLKPALRVLKRIRDYFKQMVHSYAIKTLFLWELHPDNPSSSSGTFPIWQSSLSRVVIYMLEKYLEALVGMKISYFWDRNLNLLSYLSEEELTKYQNDIKEVLNDLEDFGKYFKLKEAPLGPAALS